jgi:hypothetical protein
MIDEQTQLKLEGQSHIPDRLVSLDDPDARPIQKGKSHPKTEFGTPFQTSFNRQGFMITAENFIGKPNDKTLYSTTLERFRKCMGTYPCWVVTDLGYCSLKNLKLGHKDLDYVFMGNASGIDEDRKEAALKARSATEGFMAVAKTCAAFVEASTGALRGPRYGPRSISVPTISRSFSSFILTKRCQKRP